jgi:hypothetical protein
MEVNLCFFLKKNVIGYIFSEYSLFSTCNSDLRSCHTKKTIDSYAAKTTPGQGTFSSGDANGVDQACLPLNFGTFFLFFCDSLPSYSICTRPAATWVFTFF